MAVASSVVVVSTSTSATGVAAEPDSTPAPSAPGRLAYTTSHYVADFEGNPGGSSMSQRGLGTIGLDGTDRRTLTDPDPEPGDDQFLGIDNGPQWSPDGSWIAYNQIRPLPGGGSVGSVALIPRDGGDPQVVDEDAGQPAWSPDGRHLAWVSVNPEGGTDIAIADVDTTSSSVVLTNRRTLPVPHPAQGISSPTFSPDGQSLVFANGSDHLHQVTLYSMSTEGQGLTQLSHGVSILTEDWYRFEFSPRGTKLLFWGATYEGDGNMTRQAFLVNPDGTDQQPVAPTDDSITEVTWSPSGEALALISGTTEIGIRLIALDGEELGWLTRGDFDFFQGLTFSPDGSRVYSVVSPTGARPWAPNLYAFPLNGEDPQRLTTDQSVFPWSVQAIDPGGVLRQFGDGAVATAAASVSEKVDTADTLVLSAVDDYASSLAAAPLAAQLEAPLLVTRRDRLSPLVLETADRLGVSNVVLVGPLSPEVEASLRAAGLSVNRVGDVSSPHHVGAAIAAQLTERDAFVVPVDTTRPDAWELPLATAGPAALQRRPMLYSTRSTLTPATRAAIRSLAISTVTVVGGDRAVGPRLLRQLEDLGVTLRRVRSADHYGISARLASRALAAGASGEHPIIASGASWTSSAAAPALAALLAEVPLLVDDRDLADSRPTATWMSDHGRTVSTADLLGGVRVLRPHVEMQLERRILR